MWCASHVRTPWVEFITRKIKQQLQTSCVLVNRNSAVCLTDFRKCLRKTSKQLGLSRRSSIIKIQDGRVTDAEALLTKISDDVRAPEVTSRTQVKRMPGVVQVAGGVEGADEAVVERVVAIKAARRKKPKAHSQALSNTFVSNAAYTPSASPSFEHIQPITSTAMPGGAFYLRSSSKKTSLIGVCGEHRMYLMVKDYPAMCIGETPVAGKFSHMALTSSAI